MNEDEASYYRRRDFSIGSEQELDSLSAIQSVNTSQNTVDTILPSENQYMDDYFPDRYKPGGIRPTHHGHPYQDNDPKQGSSQSQGHHDRSVEMSQFTESPVRRLKKKVSYQEEGHEVSAPPAYHRELSDAYIDGISRTPRYNSGKYRNYDEMISDMSEGDPFRGPYQPSGKKPAVKDREKVTKMSKSNTDRMPAPPTQQSGDSAIKIHKKRKKRKHVGADSNESTGTYVINGKPKQDHTFLLSAHDLDSETGAYTSSHNKTLSNGDEEYRGEGIHKSLTVMSKPALARSPRINTHQLIKIQDALSNTTSDIDKDALANFINEKEIKQRECKSYIPKEIGDDCQCGRNKEWHDVQGFINSDSGIKRIWHMKNHSKDFPCDSFGEIKFEGFGNETANSPYIRVDPETDLESLWTIMTKHWKLPIPKLLISVTGGAKRFNLSPKHQLIFKRGLMNAATTTGAWIITGGMGAGVMKFVGEAIRDHILTKGISDKNIVALGIATWGCVANRESLDGEMDRGLWPAVYSSEDLVEIKEVPLDHNHTHFILVDDGSINKYGVEIELGARLEKFISKKIDTGVAEAQSVDLPVVKIVVEGGVNTMKTVSKSVMEDIPVLALQGSGRAADFIAFGYQLSKVKDDEEKSRFPANFDNELKEKAGNVFEWKTKDSNKDEQVEECVRQLKDILTNKRKMINVFNLNEADTKDIDKAILYALLKANRSNASAQLALALAWNRPDIARNEIFKPSNREQWKNIPLYDAMFTALVQDRVDFVQLFLDCGVSFSKFLSIETLWNLYACALLDSSDSSTLLIAQLMMYLQQSWTAYLCCRQPENFGSKQDLLNSVGKIIVHLLGDESMNLYSDQMFIVNCKKPEHKWLPGNHGQIHADGNQKQLLSHHSSVGPGKTNKRKRFKYDLEHPEKDLFIWAILFNRREMAKMFWKISRNQIGGALVACALLKNLAIKADNDEELELSVSLQEHSVMYEDLATSVLAECYRKNKQLAHQLVVRRLNMYGKTTLFTLADANELMKFMGHTCCQTKLNLIWKGRMAQYTQIWKILISIVCPIMIPLIKFTSNQAPIDQTNFDALMEGEEVEEQPKEEIAKNQVKPKNDTVRDNDQDAEVFTRSKTHRNKHGKKRLYNVTMFSDPSTNTIGLFSAIYYFYTAPITVFIVYNISYLIFLAIFTYFVLTELDPNYPSVLEYVTWGWTVTMLLEEFRQVVARDQRSFKFKVRSWFSGIWNRFDLVMYMLFLASVIARYALSDEKFVWARITYSITLAMYYLRFMQAFFVEKHIGPKVIMIKNMIVDLMFFVLIFVIFLLSFGVAYQANLFPNSEPSWYLLKSVVYMPYWQMYGELFLDNMEGKPPDGCETNETLWRAAGGQGRCPSENALVPLLGAIYVVLTNILLINLLIAMFSYTFQQVQEQSENVWRFYRFSLVYEYYDRPFLCPPFLIFSHIFRFVRYVLRKCGCKISKPKNEFKLELSEKDNSRLTLFEKSALEEYSSCFQRQELETVDRKVTTVHERLETVIEDLDSIKESVKLQENLSKGMELSEAVTPLMSSRKSSTVVKDDTIKEMQTHLDDLGEQVAQNSYNISQMMQMMQQMLRYQERNMRTPHLEISEIGPSADA
ncbi:hypothetical protein ACJMK2_033732 [Sinanodonta woodiana]|uniref:Uncharacterized protein n=1 Tax=Sinanodonta woodiana TaxID=1069815 RepID=A0ABD3WPV6_SINWO